MDGILSRDNFMNDDSVFVAGMDLWLKNQQVKGYAYYTKSLRFATEQRYDVDFLEIYQQRSNFIYERLVSCE